MSAVGAWPVPCAPYGRSNGMACALGPEWPPWGLWPVPWVWYGRRLGLAGHLYLL